MLIWLYSVKDSCSPHLQHKRFIWSKADFESLSRYVLSIDWDLKFYGLSANECYSMLIEEYNKACDLYIPVTFKAFSIDQDAWVTPQVKEALKRKRLLWHSYLRAGRFTHAKI